MRMWRSHPVRFAALIGALVGLANAILIEVGGVLNKNSSAVVLMLWPASKFGSGVNESTAMQTALFLFVEVAANVLVYALIFAVPVGLIVLIRRVFASRKSRLGS